MGGHGDRHHGGALRRIERRPAAGDVLRSPKRGCWLQEHHGIDRWLLICEPLEQVDNVLNRRNAVARQLRGTEKRRGGAPSPALLRDLLRKIGRASCRERV